MSLTEQWPEVGGKPGVFIGPYSSDLDINEILKRPLDRVTKSGQPYSLIEWPGFQRLGDLHSPILDVLCSKADYKLPERESIVNGNNIEPIPADRFFGGQTVAESPEDQSNGLLIANGKIDYTFMRRWNALSPSEQEDFLKRHGMENPEFVWISAEDRSTYLHDPEFLIKNHPAFQDLREHPNAIVADFFNNPKAPMFGDRLKETLEASATYDGNGEWLDSGPIALMHRLDKAYRDTKLPRQISLGIAGVLRPLKPGVLPENGIFFMALAKDHKMRPLTDVDREVVKNGGILEIEDFEFVPKQFASFENETVADARRALRDKGHHTYFSHTPLGVAYRTFIEAVDVPERPLRRLFQRAQYRQPKVLDASQLIVPPKTKKVAGYDRTPTRHGGVRHLGDIAAAVDRSHAVVISEWPKDVPHPEDYGDVSERLGVKLHLAMVHDLCMALGPHGSFNRRGSPVVIHRNTERAFSHVKEWFGSTVKHKPEDYIRPYFHPNYIRDTIRCMGWSEDALHARPAVNPDEPLPTPQKILERLGLTKEDLGYCVAGLAAAGLECGRSLGDIETVFGALAEWDVMTTFSSGGSFTLKPKQSGMKSLYKGPLERRKVTGASQFRIFGSRTPIVADAEGYEDDFRKSLKESGYNRERLIYGAFGTPKNCFVHSDGQVDIFTMTSEQFWMRQAIIFLLAHSAAYFRFGHGGSLEFSENAEHNRKIAAGIPGGMYPGSGKGAMPIFLMNRGAFNSYLEKFTLEELEIMQVRQFADPQEMALAIKLHAVETLGLDISVIRRPMISTYVPGGANLSPER